LTINKTKARTLSLCFEYTQPIRPQQFYADLDSKLDGLISDEYKHAT